MNKMIIILFVTVLAWSCKPSQTQDEAAEVPTYDTTEVGEDPIPPIGEKAAPFPEQVIDRDINIDPADFQSQSAARELATLLAGGSPAGKSVRFHYLKFDKGGVIFPETGAAAREVDEVAVILRNNPGLFVEIAAFANDGNRSERLGIQRAFFVKNRLIEDKVGAERIDTKGFAVDSGGERVEVRVIRN